MPRFLIWLTLALATLLQFAAAASAQAGVQRDRWFDTTDNVRLHWLEAGPLIGHTILFVPGLAMPAWIWQWQIQELAHSYHIAAIDPRGQGGSEVPATGYDPFRRGQDIADMVSHLEPVPVVIVAWSLGVLDTLSYLHVHGDALVAGLILVDNSVGEEPAPVLIPRLSRPGPRLPYPAAMRQFVLGMFRRRQDPAWLDRLTESSLILPEFAEHALRTYPLPRSYWKEAVYGTSRPLLYVVRPRWAAQAANLARNRPGTETAIFSDAGHALFVDDPARFNMLIEDFLRRRVWP